MEKPNATEDNVTLTKNTPLSDILNITHACKCNSCSTGCKYGSGFLVEEDIAKIANFLGVTEKALKENFLEEVRKFNTKRFRPKILRNGKQYGKCIFFDESIGCKIHEVKPLECKISMGCKPYGEQLSLWFMLNYFVNANDAESMREYATYLKVGGKTLKE
ncbi:YkgJ family cysteine cluster protein [Candidatus Woesearchaeota archaeon]|nr:YkgJ family cysteine cluster protein [Candidatus Woesearchaeota archaeon]